MATDSQNQLILRHLKAGHVLTPIKALNKFGCFRLAARIYDLELLGHKIARKPVKVGRDKTVTAYYMEKP